MAGGAYIDARAAADADVRFFIIRRADGFMRTAGKKTDGAHADNFFANAHAGTA